MKEAAPALARTLATARVPGPRLRSTREMHACPHAETKEDREIGQSSVKISP
jgi:hypothetical protein